jgi:predicted peptidase
MRLIMQTKRLFCFLHHSSFLLIAIFLPSLILCAQDQPLFEKHWLINGTDTLPYRLLLPKDYHPNKKYPLVLFLHGSGERGNDNEKQLVHGAKLFLQDSVRENYPAIVVFPQCSEKSYWSNVNITYDSVSKKRIWAFPINGEPSMAMRLLMQLVKELPEQYQLDNNRLYVGGLSMGGMGTFELVRRLPKTFAAAFPICGGANPATAKKLKKPHWWIFHGLADDVVPPELSKAMADALVNAGATIRLNLYPGVNHNSWDRAFAEPELMRWLFSKRK